MYNKRNNKKQLQKEVNDLNVKKSCLENDKEPYVNERNKIFNGMKEINEDVSEMINKLIEGLKIACEPDEFFGDQGKEFPFSIFELDPSAFNMYIGGKNGQKLAKAYQDVISKIDLATIIQTMKLMDDRRTKSLLVFDKEHFMGMITNGDLQRAIIANKPFDATIDLIVDNNNKK